MKAGIIGSTGYAGQQLVGLLINHPKVEISFLSSYTYEHQIFSDVYGIYDHIVKMQCISLSEALEKVKDIDVLFIALPHGQSLEIIEQVKNKSVKIIDFGADFRMKNHETIESWYGLVHQDLDLLHEAVYGLPELNKDKIMKASIIANPGCYPTTAILGLLPIIREEYVDHHSIIIDAKSGVTGAGRKATLSLSFAETNESIKAYSVGEHRHTPEIEEVLNAYSNKAFLVNFTPHLVPMQRGILSTIYVNLKELINEEQLMKVYKNFYKSHPFVRIIDQLPETKNVVRTNFCDISVRIDQRTNRLIIVSAIDNLLKGAAGTAVHNMNLLMGYEEDMGLNSVFYYL
ncbi:MAG: N-acetyl-gamma-glutamyl-phosphate reductase [Clostridia bacterium]|nr:N-acetyl-gamma-glutamyl-phosphate reductase [Clostridia bacterium]